MPLQKGTRRYRHNETGEVKYFKNEPDDSWTKVGTPGSKKWRWINNSSIEKFISPSDIIPEGFILGRIKSS